MSMTVVVDFDGTIARYEGYKGPGIYGAPLREAVETLAELRRLGYAIIVFTSRSWVEWEDLRLYFDEHKIPCDQIICGKPLGVAYIDDRSTGRGGDWEQVRKHLGLRRMNRT